MIMYGQQGGAAANSSREWYEVKKGMTGRGQSSGAVESRGGNATIFLLVVAEQ